MRRPRGFGRWIIVLGGVILAGGALVPDALGLRPARGSPAVPEHYGIIYEPVSFASADSLLLADWFYPAQDTAGIANELVGRLIPVPERLRRAPRSHAVLDPAPRATAILCERGRGEHGRSHLLRLTSLHAGMQRLHVRLARMRR